MIIIRRTSFNLLKYFMLILSISGYDCLSPKPHVDKLVGKVAGVLDDQSSIAVYKDELFLPFMTQFEEAFEKQPLLPNKDSFQTKTVSLHDALSGARLNLYAAEAFEVIRRKSGLSRDKFIDAIMEPLVLKSKQGSKSVLFLTTNGQIIIKSLRYIEYACAKKFYVDTYVKHISMHPDSTLVRCYAIVGYRPRVNRMEYRMLLTNNIVPTDRRISELFDLKGCTVHRWRAHRQSKVEEQEATDGPLHYKDMDFRQMYPGGFVLTAAAHKRLMTVVEADVNLLTAEMISDYSMLIAVEKTDTLSNYDENKKLSYGLPAYVNVQSQNDGNNVIRMQPVRLYFGIIDIMGRFGKLRRTQHEYKKWRNGEDISIHKPDFYGQRFLSFMKKVFQSEMVPNEAASLSSSSALNKHQ